MHHPGLPLYPHCTYLFSHFLLSSQICPSPWSFLQICLSLVYQGPLRGNSLKKNPRNSYLSCCFETRSHYVALTGLKFPLYTKLAVHSRKSSCLCLQNAGTKGMCHHQAQTPGTCRFSLSRPGWPGTHCGDQTGFELGRGEEDGGGAPFCSMSAGIKSSELPYLPRTPGTLK